MKKAILFLFLILSMTCFGAYQYNVKGNQGWLTFDSNTTLSLEAGVSGKDKDHENFIDRGEGISDYGWYNLDTGESGSFKNKEESDSICLALTKKSDILPSENF